eukprot:15472378-Alexandrium_andersonii.AAC.1
MARLGNTGYGEHARSRSATDRTGPPRRYRLRFRVQAGWQPVTVAASAAIRGEPVGIPIQVARHQAPVNRPSLGGEVREGAVHP